MINTLLKKEMILFLLTTFFAIVMLLLSHKYLLFSPDVSYLLHAANQMLEGGHYVTDIFETNPPMILYLYFPACLLAKVVSIDLITAMRIYILCLMVISSGVCFVLLKRMVGSTNDVYFKAMYGIFFGALFFLPIAAFAQREHLLIIFMLPYLLMAALRLDNKNINPWLAVGVGLFAGFGFALKPYFLTAFCLVELLFIFKKRKLFAWVRIESLMVASVLVIYLLSVFIFQKEYIKIILSLVYEYYFSAIKQPWVSILSRSYAVFCFFLGFSYLFFAPYDKYKNLGLVIYMALLGMIIAFIIPQNAWFYHVFPAWALALILTIHCFAQQIAHHRNKPLETVMIAGILLITLLLPMRSYYDLFCYSAEFFDRNPANRLVEVFNKLAGEHTITCFTALGTSSCFPAIYHIKNGSYQGRFPSFWWYRELISAERKANSQDELSHILDDKKYLMTAVADDLNRYKTRWVIVDIKSFRNEENPFFDVMAWFAQNEPFKNAWQNYAYYMTIENYEIYLRKS